MDTWEFFCTCYTAPTAIWTRWRWRRVLSDGARIEGDEEFITLPECKAGAAREGFSAENDRYSIVPAPYIGDERRSSVRARALVQEF